MKERRIPVCEIMEADEYNECIPIGFTPQPNSRVQDLASLCLRWVPSARELRELLAQTRRLGVRVNAIWPVRFSELWTEYGPAHTTTVTSPVLSSTNVTLSIDMAQDAGTTTFVPVVIISLIDYPQITLRKPGTTGWPQICWRAQAHDVLAILLTLASCWKELEVRAPPELRRRAARTYSDAEPIPHHRSHWTNGNFDDFDGQE